jgi:pyridoxal 5-phosphate dependent beta-lyase
VGALCGFDAEEVSFSHSAADAMAPLLSALRPATVAVLPGEYQRTVTALEQLGTAVSLLPTDERRRLDLGALPDWLARHPVDVVVLCAVSSHVGLSQPVAQATQVCREVGVTVVVDAAQALGQVDLVDLQADALVSTSRKWLAGPRGVGLLCVRSDLDLGEPPPWLSAEAEPWASPRGRREPQEAFMAGRVGLAVALEELTAADPVRVVQRLHWLAGQVRRRLDGVAGWSVVEAFDEPSAITTLHPPAGRDVTATRLRLLTEHAILTTVAGPDRSHAEAAHLPVLRVSPHLDADVDDVEVLAAALSAT